jgi:adenylate kinase family enzyme
VIETQQVLYYEVPQEVMLERCMKRAETSGRSDDNAETIKKRV